VTLSQTLTQKKGGGALRRYLSFGFCNTVSQIGANLQRLFPYYQVATLTNIKETRKICLEQVKQFKNTLWAIDQIANSLLIKTNFRISAPTTRKS
jgi:hypothetical protein